MRKLADREGAGYVVEQVEAVTGLAQGRDRSQAIIAAALAILFQQLAAPAGRECES